jgi:predicted nuclease with TOPRIM domain
MEGLKEVIAKYVDPEKVDAIVDEINKELPKHFIPKGRFNEINDELKIVKTQNEEMKKSVEDLSAKASTIEEYQKQIADLSQKNTLIEDTAKKQVAQITKRTQLKELLLVNNVHKDAVDLLVDKYQEKVEVDDKGIVGSEDLLKTIKTEKAGLFITTTVDSTVKNENTGGKPQSDAETEKMRNLFGLPERK